MNMSKLKIKKVVSKQEKLLALQNIIQKKPMQKFEEQYRPRKSNLS